MARFDEAISEAKQAQGLDPLSLGINVNVGSELGELGMLTHFAAAKKGAVCKQIAEGLEAAQENG